MKKWWLVVVMVLVGAVRLSAQQLSDSYYRENPSWVDAELWATEGEYQLLTTKTDSPFEHYALYGFSFVEYSFRGERTGTLTTRLGAIDLRNPLSRNADWGLISLLRKVPSERTLQWSNAPAEWGAEVRGERFDTSPHKLSARDKIDMRLSTRTYTFGAGYSAVGAINPQWNYSLSVGGRWGRDSHIKGLFDDEEYLWLSGERVWNDAQDRHHSVQVALMVAPTLRSQRSWNTEEVFELAGDRHYNSYWGYQNGKVRSQRVRRECVPTLYASWNIDDRYILSNINISTLLRVGTRGRSTLDWVNSPSPLPDYAGYLPSGASDPEVGHLAGAVWREGDVRYTQIDWEALYRANALSDVGAHYALLEDREDLLSGVVDISAGLLGVEGGRIGVRTAVHTTHNYTSIRDLMGGGALAEGFDLYDYNLTHSELLFYGAWRHNWDGCYVSVAAEAGGESVDYGARHNSRKVSLTTPIFRSRVTMMGPFSESSKLGGNIRFDIIPPYWGDRLGAYEGAVVRNPYAKTTKALNADVWRRWDLRGAELNLALYVRSESGGAAVEHFWNDLSGKYSALMAGQTWVVASGCEASLTLRPARGLTITAHGTIGWMFPLEYGTADIVAVEDGTTTASKVHLNTIDHSSSPQLATAIVARYFTPRGWLIGAEWAYVAWRVMNHSLLLTSDYILERNLSPEDWKLCTKAIDLGDAHNLGLFVWRKFGPLSLSLSVRNLLNFTNAYSGGYQPSRLAIVESDTKISYTPHAPKFQYIYPRHAYLTITYEF